MPELLAYFEHTVHVSAAGDGQDAVTLWFHHLSNSKKETFQNCVWRDCKNNDFHRRLALRNTGTFSTS